MCGIWGFVAGRASTFNIEDLKNTLDKLFVLSESRGKEASGLALVARSRITVLKRPVSAHTLISMKDYATLIDGYQNDVRGPDLSGRMPLVAIGHARMVTNGSAQNHQNNQPVIKDSMVCIHNGIIVNDEALWTEFPGIKREYEVDTEVLLSLISHFRSLGNTFIDSVVASFRHLRGANTVALLSNDLQAVVLATTNGSLYFSTSVTGNEFIFASEFYFLNEVIKYKTLMDFFRPASIVQVKPGEGYALTFEDSRLQAFNLNITYRSGELPLASQPRTIQDVPTFEIDATPEERGNTYSPFLSHDKLLAIDYDAIKSMRRCSVCLLPETFPFIEFDTKGVCNYCHNYKRLEFAGEEALKEITGQRKPLSERPNCIVGLSGGRDSCYGIHYIKRVLKMHPIAYTYDWGMVTDLARRNISRLCGELGIEHILVSADIKKKRAYIRKNVLAWLKRPDLGTVPLFMAGDKQYFYYANKLMEQYGIKLFVMSENRLERTHFKHGFCGIRHSDSDKRAYDFTMTDTVKLALYYMKAYIVNPAYINASLIDTVGGFLSFYLIPHNYLYIYNYLKWDEKKIESTLINEYDWEVAKDTKSTWRIGDGTAPFYNYIYYVIAGFTENDTFRSNQIREGLISREKAWELVSEQNMPRYESIKWYCDTIGIDFESAMRTINSVPKLYKKS